MTRYPLPPDAPIPDDVIDALTMTPGLDRVREMVTAPDDIAPSAHPRTASQPGAPPLAGTGERVPGVPDGTPAAPRGVPPAYPGWSGGE